MLTPQPFMLLHKIVQAIHGATICNIIVISEKLPDNELPCCRVAVPCFGIMLDYITTRVADNLRHMSDIGICYEQKPTFGIKVTPDNSYDLFDITLMDT